MFETIASAFGAAKSFLGGGVGDFLGSALSFLGGERANQANASSAQNAQDFNAQQAQQNREFQEQMSRTAHQRQVEDMRAAGLNPILSATGGKGASSPSGSTGSGVPFTSSSNTLDTAVTSAQSLRRSRLESDNLRRSNDLIAAQTDQAKSSAAYNSVLYNKGLHDVNISKENAREAFHAANIAGMDEKGRNLEGQIDETKYGEVLRYINRALGTVNSATRLREGFRQR